MRIGILGSGLMGGKLGTIFARAGHEVVFSYSHSGVWNRDRQRREACLVLEECHQPSVVQNCTDRHRPED